MTTRITHEINAANGDNMLWVEDLCLGYGDTFAEAKVNAIAGLKALLDEASFLSETPAKEEA